MPNTIKFRDRREVFARVFKDFDVSLVSTMDANVLVAEFQQLYTINNLSSVRNSWRKWCKAVVDSARFLSSFEDVENFDEFVKSFAYNADTRAALPLYLSANIRGLGFALCCDVLKELGYLDYPKPDTHIIKICRSLDLVRDEKQMSAFRAIVDLATDNGQTPYKTDKILWIISTGELYKDKDSNGDVLRVKPRETELVG